MSGEIEMKKLNFNRTKVSALTGMTEVRYTTDNGFMIIADQMGIRFENKSPIIHDHNGLNTFAKAVSDAYADHRKLMPKIVSSVSDH